MRKYIRAFLLLLITGILCRTPEVVSAEDQTVTGNCGDTTTWTVNLSTGQLTLGGTGSVTKEGWEAYRDKITSVYIGRGISSIWNMYWLGDTLFTGTTAPCGNVESFVVAYDNQKFSSENGVLFNKEQTILLRYPRKKASNAYFVPTSVKEIREHAFCNVQNLQELSIPGNVKKIKASAITECERLQKLYLSEGLQEIESGAFKKSLSLQSVTIPASVQTVGDYAFADCGRKGYPGLQEGNRKRNV